MFSSEDPPAPVCPANVQSVDDFVPDERLDKSFLEDSLPSKSKGQQRAPAPTVDSDRWDFTDAFVFVNTFWMSYILRFSHKPRLNLYNKASFVVLF